MVINFLVNIVANGWEWDDTRLGGTEESVVRWADELANRGHEVHVFRNGKSDDWKEIVGDKGSINYWPRHMFKHEGDVTINLKSSEIKPAEGERMFYLTNETDANRLDLSAYEAVIWPSQWAVDNIQVNNKTVILPHGYDSSKVKPGKKITKQVLYASSPDRGLDHLLACWPAVYKNHPGAHLIVTYGAPAQDIDGVTFLGEVDEQTMDELYATSDIWAHPCSGGELYGMTAVKAQAAGCVPVYIPTMALAETVKHGVVATEDNFQNKLIAILGDEERKEAVRQELAKEEFVDWKKSTDILEDIIGAQ